MKFLFAILILILSSNQVLADGVGPYAPACPGCPEFKKSPYPKSGLWFDPERSGTGINIDIQDGIMVAVYYGYREGGEPVWYIFSGKDERFFRMVFWEGDLFTQVAGELTCSRADEFTGQHVLPEVVGDEPLCIASTSHAVPDGERRLFYMPVGNLGDRSFQAVSPDGWIMEGIRVGY